MSGDQAMTPWKQKHIFPHVTVWDAGDRFVVTTTYFQGFLGKQTLELAGIKAEKAETPDIAQAMHIAEAVNDVIQKNQPKTKKQKGKRR